MKIRIRSGNPVNPPASLRRLQVVVGHRAPLLDARLRSRQAPAQRAAGPGHRQGGAAAAWRGLGHPPAVVDALADALALAAGPGRFLLLRNQRTFFNAFRSPRKNLRLANVGA
jgi:hypothetical protein